MGLRLLSKGPCKMDDKVNTYRDTYSNPTLAPSSNIFKHKKLKEAHQDSAMKTSKKI